jgi:hypothetical protein
LKKVKSIFASLLVLSLVGKLVASPTSDLSSPSQETRDAAAKILRSTYSPSPRTNWDSLVASIKVGENKTNVIEMLRRLNIKCEGGAGTGTFESRLFRLDDLWILELSSEGDRIVGRELREQMRDAWVLPPTNFSGVWTTYWVNGQRSAEVHVKDGKYSGEFTGFSTNGSRAHVQQYDKHSIIGKETGFFPSGHISYQGQHETNASVGIWIWYNEDGSTNSIKDYSKP